MASSRRQLRTDVLTGRQLILAAGRQQRPVHTHAPANRQSDSADVRDPFQEGHECDTPNERLALRKPGSAANDQGWLLRVVPNRYPAVTDSASTDDNGIYGIHEVVIECPDSRDRLTDLSVEEVARVFFAWQTRIRQIAADRRIQSIAVFRNQGSGAGASLTHCHSQILATDFQGNQLRQRVQRVGEFQQQSRPHLTLFDNWLESELTAEDRIVAATDLFVTVCPYASRVDWHTRFVPHEASFDFKELAQDHIVELAQCVCATALALQAVVGDVDHNLTLVLPPNDAPDLFPWMLEFLPRQNRVAGFEILTDTDILTVAPETAANRLRQNTPDLAATDPQAALQPIGYAWVGPE